MNDDAFKQRALARQAWPVVRKQLHDADGDDLSSTTTPEERVAMIWRLTQDAWALAGLPIRTLPRAQWPGTVIRRTKT